MPALTLPYDLSRKDSWKRCPCGLFGARIRSGSLNPFVILIIFCEEAVESEIANGVPTNSDLILPMYVAKSLKEPPVQVLRVSTWLAINWSGPGLKI
jgi:hypothetical protein